MLRFNEFLALILWTIVEKKFAHKAKTLNFLHIKFWIFHTLIQMCNTIFFLISGVIKEQSLPFLCRNMINIDKEGHRMTVWMDSTLSRISWVWWLGLLENWPTFLEKCYIWVLQYTNGLQLVLSKTILIKFCFN